MPRNYLLVVLSLILLGHALAAEKTGPESYYKLTSEEDSPLASMVVEYYQIDETKIQDHATSESAYHQIWLASYDDRTSKALLCEYGRHAKVVFSPDESHLVVEDHYASNGSTLDFFQRKGSLHYARFHDPELADGIWRYFTNQFQLKAYPDGIPYDHAYLEAVGWSHDGTALLVRVGGHDDSGDGCGGWYCVLDLETLKPTMNPQRMNRGAVKKNGKTVP